MQKLFETIETNKTSYKKRNCLFATKEKRLWKFYANFCQDANYSYRDQINSYVRFVNNRKLVGRYCKIFTLFLFFGFSTYSVRTYLNIHELYHVQGKFSRIIYFPNFAYY